MEAKRSVEKIAQEKIDALDSIRIDTGFQYFSGYYPDPDEYHNHPTIFASSSEETGHILTVTGNDFYKEFSINEYSKAVEAYKSLLLERGYKPSN